jgi:hypothetical protein
VLSVPIHSHAVENAGHHRPPSEPACASSSPPPSPPCGAILKKLYSRLTLGVFRTKRHKDGNLTYPVDFLGMRGKSPRSRATHKRDHFAPMHSPPYDLSLALCRGAAREIGRRPTTSTLAQVHWGSNPAHGPVSSKLRFAAEIRPMKFPGSGPRRGCALPHSHRCIAAWFEGSRDQRVPGHPSVTRRGAYTKPTLERIHMACADVDWERSVFITNGLAGLMSLGRALLNTSSRYSISAFLTSSFRRRPVIEIH